jgi:hypothetical protein
MTLIFSKLIEGAKATVEVKLGESNDPTLHFRKSPIS